MHPKTRKPIRRNLCASLPPQSPQVTAKGQVMGEGLCPLPCTPEPAQKPVQALPSCTSSSIDPNMTFEIPENDSPTTSNATIILGRTSPCDNSKPRDFSVSGQVHHPPPKLNEPKQMATKRWEKKKYFFFLHVNIYVLHTQHLEHEFPCPSVQRLRSHTQFSKNLDLQVL